MIDSITLCFKFVKSGCKTITRQHRKELCSIKNCLSEKNRHMKLIKSEAPGRIVSFVIDINCFDFTISISVKSARSKGEQQLSDFVGIEYLLR